MIRDVTILIEYNGDDHDFVGADDYLVFVGNEGDFGGDADIISYSFSSLTFSISFSRFFHPFFSFHSSFSCLFQFVDGHGTCGCDRSGRVYDQTSYSQTHAFHGYFQRTLPHVFCHAFVRG